MKIDFEKKNDMIVITLEGRLDTVTSVELTKYFEEKKEEISSSSESKVLLDFKELEYVSSAGLRALLAMKKYLNQIGKDLEIDNINNVVREVFDVTGFGKMIKTN